MFFFCFLKPSPLRSVNIESLNAFSLFLLPIFIFTCLNEEKKLFVAVADFEIGDAAVAAAGLKKNKVRSLIYSFILSFSLFNSLIKRHIEYLIDGAKE